MKGILSVAQQLQSFDRLLPMRWRLPVRYRMQKWLGALEPEILLLPGLLARNPAGAALDIGANVGIYTYALARAGAVVHAFEPQLACCEVISAWAGANGRAGTVQVHHAGAGATESELKLYIPVVHGRQVKTRASFLPSPSEHVEMMVRVVPIDLVAPGNVSFIKIDVEGHELAVLQGAMEILSRDTPTLLVEIDRERHTPASFAAIVDLLSPFGYRCHALIQDRLQDIGSAPWNAPSEIYNFLFLPPDEDSQR